MSKVLPKGGSALCLCRVSNARLRPGTASRKRRCPVLEDEIAKLDWPTTSLQDKIKAVIAEIDIELQASAVDIVDMVLIYLTDRDPCGLLKLLAERSDLLKLMCVKDPPFLFGQRESR